MSSGETSAHRRLKRLALAWARLRKLGRSVKFDRLGRDAGCNLRYVVTELGIARAHEIPPAGAGCSMLKRIG